MDVEKAKMEIAKAQEGITRDGTQHEKKPGESKMEVDEAQETVARGRNEYEPQVHGELLIKVTLQVSKIEAENTEMTLARQKEEYEMKIKNLLKDKDNLSREKKALENKVYTLEMKVTEAERALEREMKKLKEAELNATENAKALAREMKKKDVEALDKKYEENITEMMFTNAQNLSRQSEENKKQLQAKDLKYNRMCEDYEEQLQAKKLKYNRIFKTYEEKLLALKLMGIDDLTREREQYEKWLKAKNLKYNRMCEDYREQLQAKDLKYNKMHEDYEETIRALRSYYERKLKISTLKAEDTLAREKKKVQDLELKTAEAQEALARERELVLHKDREVKELKEHQTLQEKHNTVKFMIGTPCEKDGQDNQNSARKCNYSPQEVQATTSKAATPPQASARQSEGTSAQQVYDFRERERDQESKVSEKDDSLIQVNDETKPEKKKRKGWKKFVYHLKPWHWGNNKDS